MDTKFKKIKLQKISEEIAGQIRDLIKEGELQPGEKLPPERTFSEMLGVGRSSLREAFNILETQGFVEARKRQGIYVRSLSTSIISDPLRKILQDDKKTLIQLYEVRKDIELASVCAASEHRTSDDLARMNQILQKIEAGAKKSMVDLQDDLDFHLAIAQSGHNIFRSHILKNIFDISEEYLQFVVGIMLKEKARIMKLLEQHRNIFIAIEKKDAPMARAMMGEHLVWVEEKWQVFINEKNSKAKA